jgi:hypothetical protein
VGGTAAAAGAACVAGIGVGGIGVGVVAALQAANRSAASTIKLRMTGVLTVRFPFPAQSRRCNPIGTRNLTMKYTTKKRNLRDTFP